MDEIILCGVDGELMEGSQTNFYAVHNGAVWTADEGVLAGTVRNLVLSRRPPFLSVLALFAFACQRLRRADIGLRIV